MAKRERRPRDRTRICKEVALSDEESVLASQRAIAEFPANAPRNEYDPQRIAVLASKWWGARSTELTVGFMEQTSAAFRDMLMGHANAWGEFCAVKFRWTQTDPIIRVAFGSGGYWSYLGTDCLGIPKSKQTMNLEGFTTRTPEAEWRRVVRHEFGHALGAPHEHARKEIIELLDAEKVIADFGRTQGWDRSQVVAQILTPLEERSLMGASPSADLASIMTYQFRASVTKSGRAIPGGHDFSPTDREFMAKIYPRPDQPPPPPSGAGIATLVGLDAQGREVARFAAAAR